MFFFVEKKKKVPYNRTEPYGQATGVDFCEIEIFVVFCPKSGIFQIWVKIENFAIFRFLLQSGNVLLAARNIALP